MRKSVLIIALLFCLNSMAQDEFVDIDEEFSSEQEDSIERSVDSEDEFFSLDDDGLSTEDSGFDDDSLDSDETLDDNNEIAISTDDELEELEEDESVVDDDLDSSDDFAEMEEESDENEQDISEEPVDDQNNVIEDIVPDNQVAEENDTEMKNNLEMEPSNATNTYQVQDSGPNVNYEESLHSIYIDYHSTPTSYEEWNTAVGVRSQEIYTVQSGDTLWDISRQIFNDGFYWTKLWSVNHEIENPHRISPGMQVRFALGTENDAPAMTVVQESVDTIQNEPNVNIQNKVSEDSVTDRVTDTENLVSSNEIVIPPPLKNYRPVLRSLPNSIPQWTDTKLGGNYDEDGIDIEDIENPKIINELFITSFVRQVEPISLGTVVENETGSDLASLFQYVYIESDRNLEINKSYYVIKNRGELRSSAREVKNILGYNIQLQGVVKIEGTIKSGNGVLYRGIITESYSPIETGAYIIDEAMGKKALLDQTGSKSDVVSQIIGGELAVSRKFLGPQSTVFLNKGMNQGINVGDLLTVRAHHKLRNMKSRVDEHLRAIGLIKIVESRPNVSTGLIVKAWDGVQTGDLTGGTRVYSIEEEGESLLGEPVLDDSMNDSEFSDSDEFGNEEEEGSDFDSDDDFSETNDSESEEDLDSDDESLDEDSGFDDESEESEDDLDF